MDERFEDSSNLDKLKELQSELLVTEQELIKRDALLAAIVQSAQDAIIARDLTGTIIVWNKAAEDLYGWTAEEMIGDKIYKIIPDQQIEEHERFIDAIRHGQSTGPTKTVRRTKDGKLVHITLTVSPIIARNEEVIGASAIEHEIFDNE